jgi:alkylation response protein AidB-like acyl-CoA dehydrogenase
LSKKTIVQIIRREMTRRGGLDFTFQFGNTTPGCEPYWYQGYYSPYYKKTHADFRKTVRHFVETEIKPYVDDWIEEGGYPRALHKKAYAVGINGALFPKENGGTPPPDFDAFHELILWDELSRAGGGGALGQLSINSMALPPIIDYGTQYVKDLVIEGVVTGELNISLAISEPSAGSDVANIQATAELKGDYFYINGSKKWITGGHMADYFTMLVRTGGAGMAGTSIILVPANTQGLRIRKMKTQFDTCHGTTFINMDDVKVHKRMLIGQQGKGFEYIVRNFNHERFVIAAAVVRYARMCYEASFLEAQTRKTFGKRLNQHQVIRFKLAEMLRLVESLHDNLERVAFQFSNGISDTHMGAQCALLKVNATKVFEYCAREASQIFGGSSLIKEGRGMIVERLYREVRAQAIPGGSEEILLDFAVRQAIGRQGSASSKL